MHTYTGSITALGRHDIFVFGSNLSGFHGAGAAGYASFGVTGNRWREFSYDRKPDGWRGLWCVKGRAEGLQHGTIGWSYAIPTVVRPGARRSIPLSQISASIDRFYVVARRNSTWRFLVGMSGGGFCGYDHVEMGRVFFRMSIPTNVWFNDRFAAFIRP